MSNVPPPAAQAPPSYKQAVSEGAAPPGAAVYQPPVAGPFPGVAYGPVPPAGQPSPYGPPPGAPYPAHGGPGPYGPPPGQPVQQQQQYGQYGPPPGRAAPVVVVAPVQTIAMVGKRPTRMLCPHCHADVETTVNTSPSYTAWAAGLILLFFGCWMGCCLIPCCMDDCMDKEHFCPNCKAFLGRYRH